MRTQAVDGKNGQREEDTLAQIGNPEDIEEFLKHVYSSDSGRSPPLESLT
jgi:hypothetical protein